MAIIHNLSSLALRQLIDGAVKAVGFKIAEEGADAVVGILARYLTDHSQRLTVALHNANDRAWRALEIALAGDSLWERCKVKLAPREYQAFRRQVQAFLAVTPQAGLPSHGPEFRQQALAQLQAARKAGLLTGGTLAPVELARQAGAFARFADPQSLLDAEWRLVEEVAGEVRRAGFDTLAHLLELRPPQGLPLLVTAVRYFFRREVETDRELFQGLTFAQMEHLAQAEEAGFAALSEALAEQGEWLEEMLRDVRLVVVETHAEILNLKAEVQQIGPQLKELGQAVLQVLEQHQLQNRALRPGDSLSLHGSGERELVKQLAARYRALPREEQRRLPALLNGLGVLEVAAGEFDAAQRDFQEVASLVDDARAKAEAHYNAYEAALERRDWAAALAALHQAAALDAGRFAPFPLAKYEPVQVLGAGGFGVVFLCRNRHSGSRVVVKALRLEGLDRAVADVFREARVLEELDHPAIIRLRDCDFADPAQTRPYVVMDYFEGPTLADYVEQQGPLKPEELLALAESVAEALHAAHARGILHRDVKPANLLVRKDSFAWRVKLIDFGLALKQSILQATVARPAARSRSTLGYSIVGTVDFAAPEQLGRHPGVAAGPPADIYGFAKTCCFALFQTTQPLMKHWRSLPPALAELLEDCLGEKPADRPADFTAVLQRLAALRRGPELVELQRAPSESPDRARPVSAKVERELDKAATSVAPGAAISGALAGFDRELAARPVAKNREEPPAWTGQRFVEVRRFVGHRDIVWSVAFSPDGRRALSASGNVFSGSKDNSVRLWEVDTGAELRRLEGHTHGVHCVAFAPGGRQAVSSSADTTIRLWDVEAGELIRRFLWHSKHVWGVAFAPDGSRFVSGSWDNTLRLWDIKTGSELCRFKGHSNGVNSVAFSPDGQRVLSGSNDRTVRLWGVHTGQEQHRFTGHQDYVTCVQFSPDGRRALSGSKDQTVRLWDIQTCRERHCFQGHSDVIYGVAFSPDGRAILSGSWDCTMRLWDVDSGRELACIAGHPQGVNSVAFSPDGRRILSASRDRLVRLWEAEGGRHENWWKS
jgi:serine/threonine protein kinase